MVLKLLTDGALDKSPSSSLLELSAAELPTILVVMFELAEVSLGLALATALLLEETEVKYGTRGSKRP